MKKLTKQQQENVRFVKDKTVIPFTAFLLACTFGGVALIFILIASINN